MLTRLSWLVRLPINLSTRDSMIEEVKRNAGRLPREMSADAGYFSGKAVKEISAREVEVFIPPKKVRQTVFPFPVPRGRIPQGMSLTDRMRRKLRIKRGRKRYELGIKTVEPVLGQIKQGRGFRQFLLRGLSK